jgi:hypothetical protein
MYIFLIHSSVVGHLDCFYGLVIVNHAIINLVCKCLLYLDLHSVGYMLRRGITESYSISILSFLRNLHTAFHNGCINWHSHQQCIKVLVSPHPHQHLLLFVFLMTAILTGMKWNLSMALTCISFIARKVENLVMHLFVICTSSFENSLSIHVPISSMGYWFFGNWDF